MNRSSILFSVSLLCCFSSWAPDTNMDKLEIVVGREKAAALLLVKETKKEQK